MQQNHVVVLHEQQPKLQPSDTHQSETANIWDERTSDSPILHKPKFEDYKHRTNISITTPLLETCRKPVRKFKVSFEYGPTDLDRYSLVRRKLHTLCQRSGQATPGLSPDYFFYLYLFPDQGDIRQVCLDLFHSVPNVKDVNVQERTDDGTDAISVCCFDHQLEDSMNATKMKEVLSSVSLKRLLYIVNMSSQRLSDSTVDDLCRLGIVNDNILQDQNINVIYDRCYVLLLERINQLYAQTEKESTLLDPSSFLQSLAGLRKKLELWKTPDSILTLPKSCLELLKTPENGIAGHLLEDDHLLLFVKNTGDISDKNSIIQKIKESFPGKTETVSFDSIFTPHIAISPGDKLFISEKKHSTLGIFGKLRKESYQQTAAITAGHVISANSTAYVKEDDKLVQIGKCIWPAATDHNKLNIFDISVIPLHNSRNVNCQIRMGNIRMYQNKLSTLACREVFKIGAATNETKGIIHEADLGFNQSDDAILVSCNDEDHAFSSEGDSGSIVFTKFGEELTALGVVCGSFKPPSEDQIHFPKNSALVVNFKNSVEKFNSNHDMSSKYGMLLFENF